MNNKGQGGELIRGNTGEDRFCRQCPDYNRCDRKGRRVFQCNTDIIEFANEIATGFTMYVWEGNLTQQPAWWFTLLKQCQGIIAEIRTDNAKRFQNKNSSR